jgi:hypothetical protein
LEVAAECRKGQSVSHCVIGSLVLSERTLEFDALRHEAQYALLTCGERREGPVPLRGRRAVGVQTQRDEPATSQGAMTLAALFAAACTPRAR